MKRMGETREAVIKEAHMIAECVSNALAHGVKHYDERELDQGIEKPITDPVEILKLLRDGHLIVEDP
jgi:hypothetical protein